MKNSELLARIDERVQAMHQDIVEIKKSNEMQHARLDCIESRVQKHGTIFKACAYVVGLVGTLAAVGKVILAYFRP